MDTQTAPVDFVDPWEEDEELYPICTQPKPELCGRTDEQGLPYHPTCN